MKRSGIVAGIIGIAGFATFVWLLTTGKIGGGSFTTLVGLLALVCIAVAALERIKEFDIKNMKVTLDQMKEVEAGLRKIYGTIEHLRGAPMTMDKDRISALGVTSGALVPSSAFVRYISGCMKRERERLARVHANASTPEQIAKGILDPTFDDLVFKWEGPEATLDDPPRSVAQRKAAGEDS